MKAFMSLWFLFLVTALAAKAGAAQQELRPANMDLAAAGVLAGGSGSEQSADAATSIGNSATVERTIAADWQLVKGPRSEVFRECVGAGRAAEGLRAGWQEQLKLCKEEIGFKAIRFHGLLCDDMGVYSESPNGEPRYNWQYIDQLYDALLAIGIRPFVEVSFMPSALASGNKTIFWWKANVTPPKSYGRWDDLITALARHWTERYGAGEVSQWRFEIWNEADYAGFFGPRDPSRRREEYFELYAHTAGDIKRVNPSYMVGGPAGSGTTWIVPMIEFCASNSSPLDFISFHAYGLGGGTGGLDEYGNQLLFLSGNLRAPAEAAVGQRAAIDGTARPGLPLHVTEWSASYSSRDPVHDSYFSAPYILEQLKRTERGVASMSYWVFSDIFEEAGPPMTPFHGGFGLLTVQGIKKPAYFAYQFLSRLGPTELRNADGASWVCRDAQGGAQVLLWDLTHPTQGKIANQVFFAKPFPAKSKGGVRVSLANVPPGRYQAALSEIGWQKNDPYSAYLEMGAPAQLTREQERKLREVSTGQPDWKREVSVGADGRFEETLSLRENDVLLLTLTPVSRASAQE
jgi:xylan 1,4-beta-xylosidase